MEEKEECIRERIKGVRVPTYGEVRRAVLSAFRESVSLPKGVRRKGMVKHLLKIDRIYRIVDSWVFSLVDKLPPPGAINEFYAEILATGGLRDYKDTLAKLRGLRKAYRNLWRDYRIKAKNTLEVKESNRIARIFVGRTLSFVRKLGRDLQKLRYVMAELRKLPCINFAQPKIVIAGMPQVGKSTFVKAVSTAEPEVSPFPFTTKEIILGHAYVDHLPIQVIDTPGILDRPFAELNDIERKALVAIRFLADALVYLVDPSPNAYYSLSQQLNLLLSIKSVFKGKKIIVIINKIDEVSPERVNEVRRKVKEFFDGEVYQASALTGLGIDAVMERVKSIFRQGV